MPGHEDCMQDVKESRPSVLFMLELVRKAGFKAWAPPPTYAPTFQDRHDHSDSGDIHVMYGGQEKIIEVKQWKENSGNDFHSMSDIRHDEILVDDHKKLKDYRKTRNLIAYVTFNSDLTCYIVIEASTEPYWKKFRYVHPKFKNKKLVERVPKQYVKFIKVEEQNEQARNQMILRRKFEAWRATLPKELQEQVADKTVITGGCIVSMLLKEKVNDFDVYFTDLETTKAVAEYYVKQFNDLHFTEKNDKTKAPVVLVTEWLGQKRVRIRIQSSGVVGENTKESQYDYFEGRPVEDGDQYLQDVFTDVVEAADEVPGDMSGVKLGAVADDKKTKFRPVFLTDNAITLSDKVQLITRFYGEPDEIHKNFDFIHCTAYWTSSDSALVLPNQMLESLLSKRLYYNGSKYPLCAMVRVRKYLKRGWYINAGQLMKIGLNIASVHVDAVKAGFEGGVFDPRVLEDQFIGVDTAYFIDVINKLKEAQLKDDAPAIDLAYVTSLIDRVFG